MEDTIRTLSFLLLLFMFQPSPGMSQVAGSVPWVGSWTLVSAQSTLDPANKLSIAPVPDGLHVTMSGETHLDFTANNKGKQTPAPGNLGFNQIELHTIGRGQAEVKEEKDGVVIATVREKVSKDGNELTTTTSTRGKADQITVWTRTGGVKNGKDPFAGEWTQDMSKSRMRQGLLVKVEPDGRGGVRFTGGFSYTARFDGKQYDVKDSRNDSVALSLADPRTVDAEYRRGDKVTQKDVWVVAADGQTMTLVSTGALETGQRATENLAFKRQ